MADNYLITGYWGEPHVTAENDKGIHAAIFGAGRFVLPVGEQFRAEYIGNNTIRIYDGKLLDNGAAAGIPAGKYIDLTISNAGQSMYRNDIIAFQYKKDTSTLIETGTFVVIQGVESADTAVDPELTQNDLLTDEAILDQFPLWRIPIAGTVISDPVMLFDTKFAGERVAIAHSEDGVAYTVDFPGIAKLYNGLELTLIPDKTSTSTAVTLNVNNLGAKFLRLPLSFNTSAMTIPKLETFYGEGKPFKVMFDANYTTNGAWKVLGMQKTSAQDLYGAVPVENGGTGANNMEEARENLGIYTPEKIIGLHVWKKFPSNPSLFTTTTHGKHLLGRCYTNEPFYSFDSIQYGSPVYVDHGELRLCNPTTLVLAGNANIDVLAGKMIYSTYTKKFYNANDSTLTWEVSDGNLKLLYGNSLIEIVPVSAIGLVHSDKRDTYPMDDEYTDGYWYVYQGQVGDV